MSITNQAQDFLKNVASKMASHHLPAAFANAAGTSSHKIEAQRNENMAKTFSGFRQLLESVQGSPPGGETVSRSSSGASSGTNATAANATAANAAGANAAAASRSSSGASTVPPAGNNASASSSRSSSGAFSPGAVYGGKRRRTRKTRKTRKTRNH